MPPPESRITGPVTVDRARRPARRTAVSRIADFR
jgi:hypothetical protein